MRVAVLGTGTMGDGMARSLLRAGHRVTVWNRSAERARPLADAGATVAGTARAAVAGQDVVVTMLFDADAVLDVVAPVADAFGDAVWAQMSTIGLAGTQRAAELAERCSLRLVDAPVLGTRRPAAEGGVVVLASGAPELRPTVQPAFDAMGSRTVWAGDAPGAGSALKLVGNAWIATLTAGVGQSLVLAAALGLDPTLFLAAIEGGQSDTPYAQLKGRAWLAGQLEPQFALDGLLKDLGLIRGAAEAAGVDPGLLSALHDTYQRASVSGMGGRDIAAVASVFRPPAGSEDPVRAQRAAAAGAG